MPDTQQAVLIAEIGTVTTRVTLVDMAADVARMIGRAEVPSTLEPPHENAALAVLAAASHMSAMTGRRLVDGTQLVMPQNHNYDGVDRVVVLTSAAGQMIVVVAAVAEDISARSAKRAIRATYTSLLQTISLDSGARHTERQDTTWIERQVQLLTGLHPDVIIIAGGIEDGAEDVLIRLAHIVGVTALNTSVDADGSQRQGVNARPLIFAGNTNARERVIEALSGRARLRIVENVRPALDHEQLNPLRREVSDLYKELVLPRLPGTPALQRLAGGRMYTTAESAALITRFLATLNRRGVIAVDVGSAATTIHYADLETLEPVVLANAGSGFGVGAVVEARGLQNIARWLPFVLGERELMHRLLNKMIRPAVQPVTREDLLLELAVVREALSMATEALRDIRPDSQYDMVIGGGGVLTHVPHPGLAALALLDGLQQATNESVLATELHLDSLGLLAAAGALAFSNAEAALSLVDNDLLANTPLATCVVVAGDGAIGERAVDVDLILENGETRRVSVAHGAISRIPLGADEKAELVLRPAHGVRIGPNEPGAEVRSGLATVTGSALGVVIDARGRPIRLSDQQATRQQQVWDWMVALGAEEGPLPFDTNVAPEALMPVDALAFTPLEELPPLDIQSGPATPESELAKLRQTVEGPKKGGLFRRN